MRTLFFVITLFFALLHLKMHAQIIWEQAKRPTQQHSIDTLGVKENAANSTFTAFSNFSIYCSQKSYKAAAQNLLKVNPLQLMYMRYNDTTINTFFADRNIDASSKNAFIKKFKSVYHAKRTPVYLAFKDAYERDQAIRIKQDLDIRKKYNSAIYKEWWATDSANLTFLYNYVLKNGWPSIENGSFYAQIIALHDSKNWSFYFPYLRKAVLRGDADINWLQWIINREQPQDDPKTILAIKNKVLLDITPMFYGTLSADTLSAYLQRVHAACPRNGSYIIYEANTAEEYEAWIKETTNDLDRSVKGREKSVFFTFFNTTMLDNECAHYIRSLFYRSVTGKRHVYFVGVK